MATAKLLTCGVCGGPLASTAHACPKCGAVNTWVHPEIERFMAARASMKLPSATAYYAKGAVLTATSEHITEPGNLTIDFGTEPPAVHADRPGYWLPVLKFFDLAQDLPPTAARGEFRRTMLYVGGLLMVAVAGLVGWKLKPTLFPGGAATQFAEQIIKESMTDPDSFVRRSSELVWHEKTASGGDAYAVKVDYSGANALGGRIRDCQTVLFMVEGDNAKWLPGDQNLPCESGDLLKRGDAKAIEVLTSGIRQYLAVKSPQPATASSVETPAPAAEALSDTSYALPANEALDALVRELTQQFGHAQVDIPVLTEHLAALGWERTAYHGEGARFCSYEFSKGADKIGASVYCAGDAVEAVYRVPPNL